MARSTARPAALFRVRPILGSRSSGTGFRRNRNSRHPAPGRHDQIGGRHRAARAYIIAGQAEHSMIDPFGRTITYLRVSVTDRCDFRCVYCMAEDMTFLSKAEVLTLEELDRLCSAFVARGVRKLRLTGGEPLVRKNVMHLFRQLSRHLKSGDLDELTLTTNGSQLGRYAQELADIGVKRVNV